MLNPMHEYFFTFLCIDEESEDTLMEVAGRTKEASKSFNILKKVEFEMRVEELSTPKNVNLDVFQPKLTEASLSGLTSVADILIIDATVYDSRFNWQELVNLVDKVNCSVLVLPKSAEIDRLIMVHEPECHSTKNSERLS